MKQVKKRILVVDDHPMMRSALAQLLNQQSDLSVCCEAANAGEALDRVEKSKPDLAIVDLSLEDKSGLELIKDIQALAPEVLVLVMSMHDESLYAERVLRAGARGYVMKKAGGTVIVEAIRQVLNGRIYVSPAMSEAILNLYSGVPDVTRHSPVKALSDREFEVFELIGEGCTTAEIARRLHISTKTVDVHRQHLKEKLKLPTSTSLVQHAVRWVETQERG